MGMKSFNRRRFITKCLGISSLTIVGGAISGCNNTGSDDKSQDENWGGANCDDLSGVSQSEIKKREGLSYVEESIVQGNHCGNCALYIPPREGGHCGGCQLFEGPVRTTGYCTQYTPRSYENNS